LILITIARIGIEFSIIALNPQFQEVSFIIYFLKIKIINLPNIQSFLAKQLRKIHFILIKYMWDWYFLQCDKIVHLQTHHSFFILLVLERLGA